MRACNRHVTVNIPPLESFTPNSEGCCIRKSRISNLRYRLFRPQLPSVVLCCGLSIMLVVPLNSSEAFPGVCCSCIKKTTLSVVVEPAAFFSPYFYLHFRRPWLKTARWINKCINRSPIFTLSIAEDYRLVIGNTGNCACIERGAASNGLGGQYYWDNSFLQLTKHAYCTAPFCHNTGLLWVN